MQRAGSARINDAAWYPEIQLMRDQGLKMPQIAAALRLSERRIRQIAAGGSEDGQTFYRVLPEPVTDAALSAECQEMKPLTADAFELFYNKYSANTLLPLHKFWVESFLANRNLIINIPPRHGKSHIFCVWLPLWLLARNRNEQILLISKTSELTKTLSHELDWHFSYNQELIKDWGRFAPERAKDSPWVPSKGQFLVLGRSREAKSGQMSIQCRGSGQQVLGMEATVVIVDDGTDPEISRSETRRQTHMYWMREQVLSRVEPEEPGTASGHVAIVGQRVHIRDMYGEFQEQRIERGPDKGKLAYVTIELPAIQRWPDEDPENPEPEVLWPEKWTYDELMVSYERVGRDAFETLYQQNPLPEGSRFVEESWLEGCRDYDRPARVGYRQDTDSQFPVVRVVSIDPSPTQWNALVVADVLSSRTDFAVAIMEIKTWKGKAREMEAEIERCLTAYSPDYVILESSTMTKWFEGEPYFQRLKGRVTVIPQATNQNKGDAKLGVDSLAGDFEMGRVRTPFGDFSGREMTELLEQQAQRYGHGYEYDALMALWFIKWNYRRLIPRRHLSSGFTRRPGSGGWGYLAREAANTKKSQDKIVKEWRKKHARVREAV